MNSHCSEKLAATHKAQLAVRAIYDAITVVDCEVRAIQFVHRLEQMADLPQEIHDAIEWFQQDRHESISAAKISNR